MTKAERIKKITTILLKPTKSKELNINFGVVNEYKARFLARAIAQELEEDKG